MLAAVPGAVASAGAGAGVADEAADTRSMEKRDEPHRDEAHCRHDETPPMSPEPAVSAARSASSLGSAAGCGWSCAAFPGLLDDRELRDLKV